LSVGPEEDPELANNLLEYANRLVLEHTELFVELERPILHSLLTLALSSLIGREQFPKKAACTFWTTLFNKGNKQTAEGRTIEAFLEEAGSHFSKNIVMVRIRPY
jgi:hypothetical protein